MVIHCQNTSSFALFQGGEAEEETRKKRSGGAPLSSTFIKVAKVSSSSFVFLLLFSRQSASLIKIRIDFDRSRKRKKQNTNEATRDDIITRTHLSTISVRTAAARARLPACTRPTSESSVCLSPARECQCSPPAGPRTTTTTCLKCQPTRRRPARRNNNTSFAF